MRSCWVKTSSIISTVGGGRVVRSCWVNFRYYLHSSGWSGGAFVLGKLPVFSPQLGVVEWCVCAGQTSSIISTVGGGRVVRSCWVNFQYYLHSGGVVG